VEELKKKHNTKVLARFKVRQTFFISYTRKENSPLEKKTAVTRIYTRVMAVFPPGAKCL